MELVPLTYRPALNNTEELVRKFFDYDEDTIMFHYDRLKLVVSTTYKDDCCGAIPVRKDNDIVWLYIYKPTAEHLRELYNSI